MFFVHLWLIMRSLAVKICSVLLVFWYLMSVIGFNVHTCSGESHSFVTTFIDGVTCADIHPEHHCGSDHHHSDESEDCCGSEERSDCCSDEFQVLAVTGLMSDDSHDYCDGGHLSGCPCVVASCLELPQVCPDDYLLKDLYEPESGCAACDDVQSYFSIWRI